MSKNRNVLFFFPDNPLKKTDGAHLRVFQLFQYFKSRDISIDFLFEHLIEKKEIDQLENSKLFHQVYVLPQKKKLSLEYLKFRIFPLFARSILSLLFFGNFREGNRGYNKWFTRPFEFEKLHLSHQTRYVDNLIKKKEYDFIILSYAYYHSIIGKKPKNTIFIVDTHDFLTLQYSDTHDAVGKCLQTELDFLRRFDVIWTISSDEKFIFSQFLPEKEIWNIPHGVENMSDTREKKPLIDIFYIASDNRHNQRSARWFFENVYPLLPEDIIIKIVGNICNSIPDFPNVEKQGYVKDVESLYRKSKITICPMLTGTGLKIKVVESLAYGIPVVCNERGIDGLLSKINNGCLVSSDPQVFANNIIQLLHDKAFYKIHSKNAESFFKQTLDINVVHKKLDNFFKITQ